MPIDPGAGISLNSLPPSYLAQLLGLGQGTIPGQPGAQGIPGVPTGVPSGASVAGNPAPGSSAPSPIAPGGNGQPGAGPMARVLGRVTQPDVQNAAQATKPNLFSGVGGPVQQTGSQWGAFAQGLGSGLSKQQEASKNYADSLAKVMGAQKSADSSEAELSYKKDYLQYQKDELQRKKDEANAPDSKELTPAQQAKLDAQIESRATKLPAVRDLQRQIDDMNHANSLTPGLHAPEDIQKLTQQRDDMIEAFKQKKGHSDYADIPDATDSGDNTDTAIPLPRERPADLGTPATVPPGGPPPPVAPGGPSPQAFQPPQPGGVGAALNAALPGLAKLGGAGGPPSPASAPPPPVQTPTVAPVPNGPGTPAVPPPQQATAPAPNVDQMSTPPSKLAMGGKPMNRSQVQAAVDAGVISEGAPFQASDGKVYYAPKRSNGPEAGPIQKWIDSTPRNPLAGLGITRMRADQGN
jgi:hypothetical protein